MKLVMTLLVRDEADILADNIEFHLRMGVDHIIATDNLSEDETPDILERFRRDGVLTWSRETGDDYSQARWVTAMAREAATRHAADWVINNDADEFWWPQAATLKDLLEAVPIGIEAVSAARANFLPRPQVDRGADYLQEMIYRESVSLNALGRPLPPKVAHRARADIEVMQGNHGARSESGALRASPVALQILHFPLRTYRQLENKILKGGAAYRRNRELGPRVGDAWRHLFKLAEEGRLREWYNAQVPGEGEIDIGLWESRLEIDTRLRDLLRPTCWVS